MTLSLRAGYAVSDSITSTLTFDEIFATASDNGISPTDLILLSLPRSVSKDLYSKIETYASQLVTNLPTSYQDQMKHIIEMYGAPSKHVILNSSYENKAIGIALSKADSVVVEESTISIVGDMPMLWKDQKVNGKLRIDKSDTVFEGEVVDGQMHGPGKITNCKTNEVIDGEFVNGFLAEKKTECQVEKKKKNKHKK